MKLPTPLLLVAVFTISFQAAAQEDNRLELSRNLSSSLQTELGTRLMTALASAGPVSAITVCQLEAGAIGTRISEASSARLGRTALKVRNPANAADDNARHVLESFQQQLENNEPAPLEYYAAADDGSARYMRSIVTQPMCLACHGSEISIEVATAIAERYPFDQATGFTAGELRGAFIVDWPAATVVGD